jgi:hypothetical protein
MIIVRNNQAKTLTSTNNIITRANTRTAVLKALDEKRLCIDGGLLAAKMNYHQFQYMLL